MCHEIQTSRTLCGRFDCLETRQCGKYKKREHFANSMKNETTFAKNAIFVNVKLRKVIKRIRVILSVAVIALLTLLFLLPEDCGVPALSWLAEMQIMPAVLSMSTGILLVWLAVTFLVGRVYCSVACPLGILQDFFSHLRTKFCKKGYHYETPRNRTRYAIFFLFVCAVLIGELFLAQRIEPFSIYKNAVNGVVKPAADFIAGHEVVFGTLAGGIIGFVTVAVTAFVSYKRGRLLCNTVCPIGSGLSLVSCKSVWQMEIDTDMCVGCGKCIAVCKSGCIDPNSHAIDPSRCVVCFNCYDVCETGAIKFTANRKRLSTPMVQEIPGITKAPSVNMEQRKALEKSAADGSLKNMKPVLDRLGEDTRHPAKN